MRPRVTPAAVVLAASLGVLVAVPVFWLADGPEPSPGRLTSGSRSRGRGETAGRGPSGGRPS